MGRTKDLIEMLDDASRIFRDISPWGENLDKWLEPLEEKTFDVEVGEYKTTIKCKFNKKGYPVSHSVVAKKIPSRGEQLTEELRQAVKDKDFLRAAEIQKEIDSLQK